MRPASPGDPWQGSDGFQLIGERRAGYPIHVDGEPLSAQLTWRAGRPEVTLDAPRYAGTPSLGWDEGGRLATFEEGRGRIVAAADGVLVVSAGRQIAVRLDDPFAVDLEHLEAGDAIKAPMHGKLVALLVAPGDEVHKGQRLAVLEAMKMEHALVAPRDGEVEDVLAEAGGQVAEGARLIVLKAEPDRAPR